MSDGLIFPGGRGNVIAISRSTEHPIRRIILDPDPNTRSYHLGTGFGQFVYNHGYYPLNSPDSVPCEGYTDELRLPYPRYIVEADGSNNMIFETSEYPLAGRYQHWCSNPPNPSQNFHVVQALDPVTLPRTFRPIWQNWEEELVSYGCFIKEPNLATWGWDGSKIFYSADEGLSHREFSEAAATCRNQFEDVSVNMFSIVRKGQ